MSEPDSHLWSWSPGPPPWPLESQSSGFSLEPLPVGAELPEPGREPSPAVVLIALPGPGQALRHRALELLPQLQTRSPRPRIVVWVEEQDARGAAQAAGAGADQILVGRMESGPWKEALLAQREAFRSLKLKHRRALEGPQSPLAQLIGSSPAMLALKERLPLAARAHPATVLIRGESGSGKELVARALHALSPRALGPFVAINCACLPTDLLEAELFGTAPGAFTGARTGGRAGLVEAAQGGTLFLDEIGELDPWAQAKLLRLLQERRYRRLGDDKERESDARLFAATHRDLEAEVEAGRLRSDLYYRLNVLELHVPPLRVRPGDLPLIAAAFLERLAAESGHQQPRPQIDPEGLAQLEREAWPGNVRELENRLRRALLLAQGPVLSAPDLAPPAPLAPLPSARPTGLTLAALERQQIERVLLECDQNKSLAARRLGLHRSTLYAKLRAFEADEQAAEAGRSPA